MMLARSILLFNIIPKSINGDADLFSTNMNSANEIIPITIKLAVSTVELLSKELLLLLPLPVSRYVSTSRNDVTATASVIAPFISIFLLLVAADFRLLAIDVFLFVDSESFLLSS